MPLFNSQPDSEFDKLYAAYKRRGEENDLLRQKKGVPPEAPEVIDARARKQAEADIARKGQVESVRAEMQQRELEKPTTPGLFERLSSKPAQPTTTPQMQQTGTTEASSAVPAATPADKAASGGVRNLSEKPTAVKPGNQSGQSTKNIPSTIDNLEEKVRIFNQRGFDTGDFKEQLTEARKVYEEDRDRNRALGLAQMVAQSIARMGAAVEGNKRGRYIGDINSPSVDYEARNAESRADYRDQVSDISARQKEAVGETKYKHEQEISAVKLRIEDEWNKRRAQQDAADKAIASKKDDARFVFNTARTQYNDVDKDQEDLKKQSKAISNLVGAIQATDLKEKAKEATYAAEAGISAIELDKLKAEAPKQSKFFGLTEGEDPKQQATYIQETLGTRFRQRLGELEAKKQEYIQQMRGTGLMPQQAAPQPVQTSGQAQPAMIVHKSGTRKPFNAETWKRIQSSDEAADFRLE